MKFAVISDVHANLEAATACFEEIDKLGADKIICLGDMVDYCAQPNEVVSLIKEKCSAVVLGNHDEAQFNHPLSERFNERARISSIHTRSVLVPGHLEYFKTLPQTYSVADLFFVHSSPCEPHNYKYIFDEESAFLNCAFFSQKVCFIGHSHRPVIFENSRGNITRVKDGHLDKNCRYIINVGSVGQPRDGDPRLSFGYFDTEEFEYRNIRVSYDMKPTVDKILKEGLPEFLALRLLEGK